MEKNKIENKKNAKLPSVSAHQPPKKINQTLGKIFKSIGNIHENNVDKNFDYLSRNKKEMTPKFVINLNHMPRINKIYPNKKILEDKSKFNIHNIKSDVLNAAEISQIGCFSPKMKIKKQKINKDLKESFFNESKDIVKLLHDVNKETKHNKTIIDVNETISLPSLNINSSRAKNNQNRSYSNLLPKNKKFVTISFNQLMLKNLFSEHKTNKNCKYISLNDMKKYFN